MKIYQTRNTNYPVYKINGFEIIAVQSGKSKGKLSKIIGSSNHKEHLFFLTGMGIYFDGKEYSYAEIEKFLDNKVEIGSCIFARHLNSDLSDYEFEALRGIVITSPVERIIEDSELEIGHILSNIAT
jgi:hypothetical protein